jgi:hypothetical protein
VGPNDPKPRVMMLETQTSEISLNPVDLYSDPADVFEYSRTGDTLTTEIVSGSSSFSASFEIPPNAPSPLLDPGWNSASDVIYWRNGVADLQNVNGLISNRRVARVPQRRASIDNQTRWAAFVERRPRWVLLFDERIDTVIQPWVNVTDPSVPLDSAFRDQLIATKADEYSANEFQRATDIGNRMAEPITDFFVEVEPAPSVFLNFILDPSQIDALAAAIPIPEGFELAEGSARHLEPGVGLAALDRARGASARAQSQARLLGGASLLGPRTDGFQAPRPESRPRRTRMLRLRAPLESATMPR